MPRRACAARSICTAMSPRSATSCGRAASSKTCRSAVAKEQDSLAGDVDALVMALDARAALEIGITQSLGNALSIEAERDALVARLRAFTPLVRGTSASHVARYIRADDAFHRIFLSLLRNQPLFDIYNAMDVPELMRRVLVVAPISIREIFDDHKALTNALRAGSADETSAAITEHANRVRTALASFLAETTKAANPAATSRSRSPTSDADA